MLGLYNGQKLDSQYDILLRMTRGDSLKSYIDLLFFSFYFTSIFTFISITCIRDELVLSLLSAPFCIASSCGIFTL